MIFTSWKRNDLAGYKSYYKVAYFVHNFYAST